MASLPPRPASQRRSAPLDESASQEQSSINRTNSEAYSTTSVDSQTLLLNSRAAASSSNAPQEQATADSHPQASAFTETSSSAPTTSDEDNEPRKCWICFNDETEDDETTSEWRSPCPCVLVAHEKCLLDWIADMEAPSSRRRAGGARRKIECPQCKSEIKIKRPRSLAVDLVRLTEKVTGMMLLPGIITLVGGAAYSTATLMGTHMVYEIFGTQDGMRILWPLYFPIRAQGPPLTRLLTHVKHHWRLDLGLPLIPTVLVLSRTTLADSVLPFLPLIFFVSSGQQDDMLRFSWPPSAAFTMAALPYVRGMYNAYYDRVWYPREQRWLKEIQPRAGDPDPEPQGGIQIEVEEEDHDEGQGMHADEMAEAVEVEVDFDIFADWNNAGGAAENNLAPEDPVPEHPLNAPPLPDMAHQDAAPAPNVPAQPPQRPRQRMMQYSITSLADTILGALLFPTIAAAVGEALKYALPKSWVTPPANGKPSGFLQAKWGRSIVGGCLAVGVKDAMMLYVRWKMAQNHRRRKIMDYDREQAKKDRERDDRRRVGLRARLERERERRG